MKYFSEVFCRITLISTKIISVKNASINSNNWDDIFKKATFWKIINMNNKELKSNNPFLSQTKSDGKSSLPQKNIFENPLTKPEYISNNLVKIRSEESINQKNATTSSLFRPKLNTDEEVIKVYGNSSKKSWTQTPISGMISNPNKPHEDSKFENLMKVESNQGEAEILPAKVLIRKDRVGPIQMIVEENDINDKSFKKAIVDKPHVFKSNRISQCKLEEIEESLRCQLWHFKI